MCFVAEKDAQPHRAAPKPNRSPAPAQPLAALPPYGCGVPLAGKRVRFGKEEQQSERALTYKISRSKRYDACSDVSYYDNLDIFKR